MVMMMVMIIIIYYYYYIIMCIYREREREREIVLSNSSFASHLQTSHLRCYPPDFGMSKPCLTSHGFLGEPKLETRQTVCKTRCGKLGWMMMDTLYIYICIYHINHIINRIIISTSPCSKNNNGMDGYCRGCFLVFDGKETQAIKFKVPQTEIPSFAEFQMDLVQVPDGFHTA